MLKMLPNVQACLVANPPLTPVDTNAKLASTPDDPITHPTPHRSLVGALQDQASHMRYKQFASTCTLLILHT